MSTTNQFNGSPPDDELVQLRGVNAHTFCPRLYWLEYVEGVFFDNEHTIEGQHVHRRVDKPGGAIAAPDSNEGDSADPSDHAPWHARSLWLSDAELGVTGKLDLVEEVEGGVMPVDTKKGRSMDGALWPADDVQLSLQAMLLERAGYTVASVAAWYASERRRVTAPLDDARRARALEALRATLATRDAPCAPEPLVDSPKCMGCSLNVACLPDEVRRLRVVRDTTEPGPVIVDALSDADDEPGLGDDAPRRVVPLRDDAIPVYVQESGATVRIRSNELCVENRHGDKVKSVGLETVSQINLYGLVHVTGPLIREAFDRDIPVCFFSSGGWYRGRTRSSANRTVRVRIGQYAAFGAEAGLQVARRIVSDKIANSRTLLRRNRGEGDVSDRLLRDLQRADRTALGASEMDQLLGVEGSAARQYWEGYSALVSRDEPAFAMNGRTRRPPRDRTNAMLSYVYGMLVKDCTLALDVVGFDPFLGLMHTPHHGRPSLALDLMEPFRSIVGDSVVLGMIRRREVQPNDFIFTGQHVALKQHARKALIRGYERRMDELLTHPMFGYQITYRQLLHVHARLLSRFLMGELAEPPSYRTR